MKCLECKKEITQTPGKRAKKFCSTTCRSNNWQKRVRKAKGDFKKGLMGSGLTPEVEKEVINIAIKDLAALPVVVPDILPTRDFRAYLTLINSGEFDPISLEKEIGWNKKLTGPQKSMIYSKLKNI